MGELGDTKSARIKQIFETMDYGDDTETTTKVTDWLKIKENRIFAYIDKKDESPNGENLSLKNVNNGETLCDVYVPEAATIETILTKQGEAKNTWIEIQPVKRAEIIYKLGDEIQKKQDLFIQLEIAVRGILNKNTKNKALPLLTDSFWYYSNFTANYNSENSAWKPDGLAVCILPDENSLSAFGYVLGPALAAGNHIILQTGPQFALVATLLIDIATQVGVPEGTIRLISGTIDPKIFFNHSKVSIISVFDDLYREKYLIANLFNKKLLHFYSSGISMLVFDNCDLDSACHSILDAAWGFKGMLPWSVRNIFIQENIFENFTQKVKHKISKAKIDASNKKNVDISLFDGPILEKVSKIVDKAKSEGVEVFQVNNKIVPTLLIGGNIFDNNVIKEDINNVPIVTLTAFRSINEAVALSNSTRQGLGVSVWTESTSLVNEIIGKLKTGNIWVNSHGLFAADIPTSPYKTSGNAYFGGKEGFYEYVSQVKTLKNEINYPQVPSGEMMEKAINEAKKAQQTWSKLNKSERIKYLQGINNIKMDKWLENWKKSVHQYVSNPSEETFNKKKGFNVITTREPRGVIAVETPDDQEASTRKIIIASLIEGNSIICLSDSKDTTDFYSFVSKSLPIKGILAVISYSQDATKVAALHKELILYLGEKNKVFFSLPLKTSCKFKVTSEGDWTEIRNQVTLTKNVWLNNGQSFI